MSALGNAQCTAYSLHLTLNCRCKLVCFSKSKPLPCQDMSCSGISRLRKRLERKKGNKLFERWWWTENLLYLVAILYFTIYYKKKANITFKFNNACEKKNWWEFVAFLKVGFPQLALFNVFFVVLALHEAIFLLFIPKNKVLRRSELFLNTLIYKLLRLKGIICFELLNSNCT